MLEWKSCRHVDTTMSKDMDEQLKLAHNLVESVNQANRKICVTPLRYSVDKPESCFAQVHLFASKKEDEKCQKNVNVTFKLEEFIYLLGVLNSVYDKVVASISTCNFL